MNAKGLTIPTTFRAIDETTSVTKQMRRGLAGFAKDAETLSARSERSFRKLTPVLGHATKQLLSYASAGAVLTGIGYSVKAVTDYEVAIQSLQAVTGVSGSQMVGFKTEIEEVAKTSRKSSIDVAKSFETIGSNMSEYLEDPKGLRQITEAGITLSKAARTELEPTLNDLTSIMNQFNIKAGEAAKAVNTLTAGEIVGSVRTSELAGYLQQFGGVASSNNVALSESVALVEAFGKQLPKEAIGTAARNLITFMSAAKGMDKKAISSMHKYGVDMNLLMDKHTALGVKIKELSKIKGDAVAMERFFGRENIAAGSVIFQQLDTYNEYEKKIRSTNKAQEQAALNSNTLQNRLKELENTWLTLITTSGGATSGIEKAKTAVGFLTEHLDTIVGVGVSVLTFFTAWKVANIALTAVTIGTNIALGVQAAVTGYSTYAIEENLIAKRASVIVEKVMAGAIALSTGNMAAFNAVLAVSPLGWALIAVGALAGAVYLLNQREKELHDQYEKNIQLDNVKRLDSELVAVRGLAQHYFDLGMNIDKATASAIRSRDAFIKMQRAESEAKITSLKQELKTFHNNENPFKQYILGGAEVGERGRLNEAILSEQIKARGLAVQNQGLTQYASDEVTKGEVSKSSLRGLYNTPAPSKEPSLQEERFRFSMQNTDLFSNAKVNDVEAASTTHTNNANATITIKNESATQIDVDTPGKSRSVMPQTSSTMSVNKR